MALIGPWLDYLFMPPLPVKHTEWIFPNTGTVLTIVVVLNLLLGIAATYGLCMFRRWSRPATLVTIIVGTVVYCLSAYFVNSGVKTAVDVLAVQIDGAVLAMAYFSPLADRFGANNSFNPTAEVGPIQ